MLVAATYPIAVGAQVAVDAMFGDALLLEDSLYYIACKYEMVHYALWPLYRNATPVQDPFQAWFDLWVLGAESRFEENRFVIYASA